MNPRLETAVAIGIVAIVWLAAIVGLAISGLVAIALGIAIVGPLWTLLVIVGERGRVKIERG